MVPHHQLNLSTTTGMKMRAGQNLPANSRSLSSNGQKIVAGSNTNMIKTRLKNMRDVSQNSRNSGHSNYSNASGNVHVNRIGSN